MGQTKHKLRDGRPALGGWIMIGHPAVAEIMAGEGFDWIGVDLEHTSIGIGDFSRMAAAVKGTGCDLLARLHSCDPVQAKLVLDAGADGVIVPAVDSVELASRAAAMCRFPPRGVRGAALSRATDYGRNFADYFARHNDDVLIVVMLEHVEAVERRDAILSTPGIDAALVGPYDLSASMGLAGQLDHPQVRAAQKNILDSCIAHGVAPGIHVVPVEGDELRQRLDEGFRFIGCGIDTLFIMHGCRTMLKVPAQNVF
ncbi:MAG: hypothetical protein JW959_13125 [Pirellulales bacterium]|nr:hypothetical protein [Pirellulales bacterium]